MPGLRDTVAVGFANGLVGLWSLASGARLQRARLHGPISHLVPDDGSLQVVTELGAHMQWDLGVLGDDYCQLMRKVWREIPVVWEAGAAVTRKPPADHRCARAGEQ